MESYQWNWIRTWNFLARIHFKSLKSPLFASNWPALSYLERDKGILQNPRVLLLWSSTQLFYLIACFPNSMEPQKSAYPHLDQDTTGSYPHPQPPPAYDQSSQGVPYPPSGAPYATNNMSYPNQGPPPVVHSKLQKLFFVARNYIFLKSQNNIFSHCDKPTCRTRS